MGPTSANSSPARFVWVRSADGKAKLAGLAADLNKAKILQAPVTVIIGHDLDFAAELPKLMPHAAERMQQYFARLPTGAFMKSASGNSDHRDVGPLSPSARALAPFDKARDHATT